MARQTLRTLTADELRRNDVRGGQLNKASNVNGNPCEAQGDGETEKKVINLEPTVVVPEIKRDVKIEQQ